MTGFCKTDQIIILGLFHFIGPANGYTCTLHIHSAITGLGWPVCFSRVSLLTMEFHDWDNGTHGGCYMEGMVVKFTPAIRRHLLMPFKHVWAYGWLFWDLYLVQMVLTKGITHLRLSTHSLHLLLPPPAHPPYNMPSLISQWFLKSCWKSSSVS